VEAGITSMAPVTAWLPSSHRWGMAIRQASLFDPRPVARADSLHEYVGAEHALAVPPSQDHSR